MCGAERRAGSGLGAIAALLGTYISHTIALLVFMQRDYTGGLEGRKEKNDSACAGVSNS